MCGRYTLGNFDWVDPAFSSDLSNVADLVKRPRYNIAPGQLILALTRGAGGATVAESMHWGIETPWRGGPPQLINARAEKLAESRFWKPLLTHGRCAIPADGFYEWRKAENGGRKQPYWFARVGGEGFAFAGLWRAAKSEDDQLYSRCCAIVTVAPNELVAGVHDRMPAMIAPEHAGQWLDGDLDEALALLEPFASAAMTARAVGQEVGNSRAEGLRLIAPADEQASA